MSRNIFKDKLTRPLVLDGAMGTTLILAGLLPGECPEYWNVTRSSVITKIHKKYIKAGSDIVQTNTFGANRIKLSSFGLEDKVWEINSKAVKIAKSAAQRNVLIALDIGPTGKILEPWGKFSFDDAVDVFSEQIKAGLSQYPDMILIETMTQIAEARAALLAAKSLTDIPVIITMAFEEDKRTTFGTSPETAALVLSSMGADAVGVNCVEDCKVVTDIVRRMAKITDCPIIAQPNAGMPELIDGKSVYTIAPGNFAKNCAEIINAGANIIGGCCGTTPKHIREVSKIAKGFSPSPINEQVFLAVSSNLNIIPLDPNGPTTFIGECINPTGKEILKKQLKDNNYSGIVKLAKTQINQGAKILDVNVGIPKTDEPTMMRCAINEIQKNINVGICIDSNNINALEEGLKTFHGRAIINSVDGKNESLNKILPLAKKYGALVIGLPMDERGVKTTASERLQIARKIVKTAAKYDIPANNIIIDGLTLSAGAQPEYVIETINTIKLVKEKLGNLTTLGISNISHGLPNRPFINQTFIAMALAAGLDMPIIDPRQDNILETIAVADLLTGKDIGGRHFMKLFGTFAKARLTKNIINFDQDNHIETQSLYQNIVEGNIEDCKKRVQKLLKSTDPLKIINKHITPALNDVSAKFECGKFFLPQLLLSSEAAQAAFSIIKDYLSDSSIKSLGKVILATVQGDIHDIGKNITKVLLENHGFTVIDLGKDVPPEKIAKAITPNTKLIGLSALMTTTVPSMEKTIKVLREKEYKDKIMVGGAVITKDLAKHIGADFYAKSAIDGVKIAKKVYK